MSAFLRLGSPAITALLFVASLPMLARAEPLNNFTAEQVANLRCAAGAGANNDYTPIKEGEECYRNYDECEGVSNKPPESQQPPPSESKLMMWLHSRMASVAAAIIAVIPSYTEKQSYITYTCKASKCVATTGCDGTVLQKPPELPDGPTSVQPLPNTNPDTTPIPATQPNVNPLPNMTPNTTPVPNSGPDVNPIPANADASPSPGAANARPEPVPSSPTSPANPDTAPSPLPPTTLPKPGTTFTPSGSPFTLDAKGGLGSIGKTGSDGVYSGGNPFSSGNNTTFTGSFESFGSGIAAVSPIASFVSSVVGLFNGLGNAAPAQAPVSAPAQPSRPPASGLAAPTRGADTQAQTDVKASPLAPLSVGGAFSLVPLSSGSGFGDAASPLESLIQGGPLAMNPAPLPGTVLDPRAGGSDAVPAAAQGTAGWSDALKERYSTRVEEGIPEAEAYGQVRADAVNTAFRGLADGTFAPNDARVNDAWIVLQGDVLSLTQARDRAYADHASPFIEWIDRNIISISAEQRALDGARARLAQFNNAYATAQLRADTASVGPSRASEIAPAAPHPVQSPVEVVRAAAQTVVEWWTGTPAQAEELPSAPMRYRLLEGLSAVASRVSESAHSAASRVAGALGLKTRAASETPAAPAPAASAAPRAQSGLLATGLQLLNTFLTAARTLLTNGNDAGANPAPMPKPALQASASISADPSLVAPEGRTKLSWTSVGTLSCAIVDANLSLITHAGGNGDVMSPPLASTTRFGVICDIEGGRDKFVNETLVRVEGDDSDPARLFAQSGKVSAAAAGVSDSADVSAGAGAGGAPAPAPIDVRTCDPQQSMDTFIRCLCQAEPNPNGCSLVQ